MSNCTSQDHNNDPGLGPSEVERVLANVRVQQHLAIKPRIDRTYDMPWLAGYSKDGRTIFIDRHFPSLLKINKSLSINAIPFLVVHEHTEKSIMDALGWKYQAAHTIAEQEEHRIVRSKGILPKDYENALRPFIKAAEREKLVRVPRDMDLQPFKDTDDNATLWHLKAAMLG